MPGMRAMRGVGVAVGVVAALVVLAGCGGGDGGGEGKASSSRSVSASASPAVAPRDALAEYQRAGYAGCTDADSCQGLMTRKLAAAVRVRDAMKAKNPALYAVPIGLVDEAERRADQYGRDSLGVRGNMAAVMQPLQQMTSWFREHPEG